MSHLRFDLTTTDGECLYCVALRDELAAEKRILARNDEYVAIMPYASHVAFETWIVPMRRQASFASLDAALLRPLAELLRAVLLKPHTALENPSFNLTIDSVATSKREGS